MRRFQRLSLSIGLPLLLLVLVPMTASCQQIPPTHRDLAYDDQHASQRLDVYLAKSETPVPAMVYIHGGGWRGGSKNRLPQWLSNAVAQGWLSVVSVEYRFTDVAPHPAQTDDCLRAIQFVRSNAAAWNIDPDRIGVTGGSAGGHLSLWVALHDDVADAQATDPIKKQSSRVACAVSFAGPTDWSLLSDIEHKHPAYRQLLGYKPGTAVAEMDADKMKDVSPISFVSSDDPSIMQVHGDADDIVPIKHARRMDKQLQEAGVTAELVVVPGANHGVAGAGGDAGKRASEFVRETIGKK